VAFQSILLAASAAGLLGAATGLALLLIPRRLLSSDTGVRRVLLETRLGDLFNRRFSIERRVYRRHRLFGALVLAGALALASTLWLHFRDPAAMALLSALFGQTGARAMMALGIAVDLVLLVVGACLWIRPSVLKGIEAAANRWVEPIPHRGSSAVVGSFVARAPRLSGAVLLVSGLACLRPF
jgi:hypothetical protein